MSHFFENDSKMFQQNSNHLNMKTLYSDGKLLQNEQPRILDKQKNKQFVTLLLQKHKSVGWTVIF